jgi:hypothetical protein
MKNSLFLLVILVIINSCATGEVVRKDIQPGMTKAKVIEILGNPDGYKIVGDQELLTYTNRLISGWSWDRADYHFVIKDNKVIAYGTGEVRVKQNNTILILPLK